MAGLDSYQDILTAELLNNMGGIAHSVQHDNVNSALQGPPFINVKGAPYLAKGDGATNDTAAIQAAIDAVSPSNAGNLPEGSTRVYLPPGQYRVSALLIPEGCVLEGAGRTETQLVITGAGITFSKQGGQSYSRFVGLRNLRVQMVTGATGYGISATDIIYYSFENLDIYGAFPTAGVRLNGAVGGRWSSVRIEGVTGAPALLIDSTGSVLATVNSHVFDACQFRASGVGIKAQAPSAGTVQDIGELSFIGGVVEANTSYGAQLIGTGNIAFMGTHFEDNTTYHVLTQKGGSGSALYCEGLTFLNPSFSDADNSFDGDRYARVINPRFGSPLSGTWGFTSNSEGAEFDGVTLAFASNISVASGTGPILRRKANTLLDVNTVPLDRVLRGATAHSGAAASTIIGATNVDADTWVRWKQLADGTMSWGSGSGNQDTNLYRSAADTLKTDDKFHVVGETEIDGALNHDGTTVGFFGTAPATQRSANADTSGATLAALETEVNELKQLLRDYGLLAT